MSETFVRLPSDRRLQRIIEDLTDEKYISPIIKTGRDNGKIELPEPTEDDATNTDTVKSFEGVILYVKPFKFYDAEKKREVEKRLLYVLRPGKWMPERFYLSESTSLYNFRPWAVALHKDGINPLEVVVKFIGEKATSKNNDFTWTKIKFEAGERLTEAEIEHLNELRPLVEKAANRFVNNDEMADIEAEMFGAAKSNRPEVDEEVESRVRDARRNKDEDDDVTAAPPRSSSRAAAPKNEDDDLDAAPRSGRGSSNVSTAKNAPPKDEDDDLDAAPAPRSRAAASSGSARNGSSGRSSRSQTTLPDDDDDL